MVFFHWSESYLLKPKTINTIVLAYDTLDKDHDLIPYKPYFVDIIDVEKKAFTVYRAKDKARAYEKAEDIARILGKPLKDYSDVENMTYYNESVFLV